MAFPVCRSLVYSGKHGIPLEPFEDFGQANAEFEGGVSAAVQLLSLQRKPACLGLWGMEFRVQSLGFRVWSLGYGACRGFS